MLDFLKEEGVDPAVIEGIAAFRAAHPVSEGMAGRIPNPQYRYYGRDVWNQAATVLLCGEKLLLAGPKATGKNVLAESLRQCGVKLQFFAFRSLRGYTVLQLLKGYQDPGCRSIFDYFAAGWNRDGLALRTAAQLANSGCKHRLLLILTDASPNDSQKIAPDGGIPLGRDYGDEAAIADTAAEVKALRKQGLRVGAIFFGLTRDVPALKRIYGSDFVRIQKMDQLAGAAGAFLQRQLREMD